MARRIATVIASGAVFATGCLAAPNAVRAQDGQGSEMGARLPWDFPLPPLDYMLHPTGNPPNGKPPETKLGRAPTMALAREAADAALAACERDELKVGVAVLDAAGDLRVAVTSQDVPPGKVYIAVRKGLSAIAFRTPTSRIAAAVDADPSLKTRLRPEMALFAGGVPLIRNGEVYGAVAASGAKAVQDEACAAAGAAAVAGRL